MRRFTVALLALLASCGCAGQTLVGTGEAAAPPVNNPPIWTGTPAPTATAGVVSSYALSSFYLDPDGDALTLADAGGCTFPTGVTLDAGNEEFDFAATTSAGQTLNCTLSVNDGSGAVTSSPFTIDITSSGEPTADVTICDSGCDYVLIQDALDAESAPGVIFEFRSTPQGTTDTWDQDDFDLSADGTEADPITIRVRDGDTIIVTSTNESGPEHVLELNDAHYYVIKGNLQFGRSPAQGSGWVYGLEADEGRFAVEHDRWLNSDNDTSSHIIFDGITAYAGSFYDGGLLEAGSSHIAFFNCEMYYAGVNAGGGSPNPAGNLLTNTAERTYFQDCFFQWGGHSDLEAAGAYSVARRNISDGGYLDFDSTAPGRGNRAVTFEGSIGPSLGPMLIEKNVIRNTYEDQGGGSDPCGKFIAQNIITRLNVIDTCIAGPALQATALGALAEMTNGIQYYNNTAINILQVVESTDINIGSAADGNYNTWWVANNLFVDILADGDQSDGSHVRVIRSNSSSAGFANAWRDGLWTNNIFDMDSGTFEVRLSGTGGATVTTVASAETEWPANWTNNGTTAPTFAGSGDVQSDTWATAYAAGELAAASQGVDDGIAHTQADGAGSSSTFLFVDDPERFAVLWDQDTYDMQWFADQGYDVPQGDCVWISGWASPVRLTDINYSTGRLTLSSAQSWSNNDDVWLADMDDCATIVDNQGGSQVDP
jgi:hypothetical protein